MNTVWSDYVQSVNTLYLSRRLRFSDRYKDDYKRMFNIDGKKCILEIGCGPGALSQALLCWYPEAEIVGVDRDSTFIQFAKEHVSGVNFVEADATMLPFDDESFDVVISYTVQEHIETSKFFDEQRRVLKKDGVCIVMSARKGVNIVADCIDEQTDFEKAIWDRAEMLDKDILQAHNVGKYAMSELELPFAMEMHGFANVSTEYFTVNLTPDNPENSREFAYKIIDSQRQTSIDAANSLKYFDPPIVSEEEIDTIKSLINARYDKRLQLYDDGAKQWDVSVSLVMVLRGSKK